MPDRKPTKSSKNGKNSTMKLETKLQNNPRGDAPSMLIKHGDIGFTINPDYLKHEARRVIDRKRVSQVVPPPTPPALGVPSVVEAEETRAVTTYYEDQKSAELSASLDGKWPFESVTELSGKAVATHTIEYPRCWPDQKPATESVHRSRLPEHKPLQRCLPHRGSHPMVREYPNDLMIINEGVYKQPIWIPERSKLFVFDPEGCLIKCYSRSRPSLGLRLLAIVTADEASAKRLAQDLRDGKVAYLGINDTVRYIGHMRRQPDLTTVATHIGLHNLGSDFASAVCSLGGEMSERLRWFQQSIEHAHEERVEMVFDLLDAPLATGR